MPTRYDQPHRGLVAATRALGPLLLCCFMISASSCGKPVGSGVLTCGLPGQNGKGPADAEDDSDQAKMQRLLDFFRDLGEQYWGWQVCWLGSLNVRSQTTSNLLTLTVDHGSFQLTQKLLTHMRAEQMESAKRGRGFKGALKEHFLPLLPHLRQLAAQPSLP
jgi:hypothetical protein